MVNNKLIHVKHKEVFLEKLNSGAILDGNIVFIQDTQEIWTHGQLYSCEYLAERVSELEKKKLNITDAAETYATKLDLNDSTDKLDTRVLAIEELIAADSDAVINKWEEIVDFLNNIGADNDLESLLFAKANVSALNETNDNLAKLSIELEHTSQDLDGKITETNSALMMTANEIRTNVSSVETELSGKINTAESNIVQTAKEIRSEVSSVTEDLQGQINVTNSTITQTAESIRSEVNKVKDDLTTGLETVSSKIDQEAERISLQVESTKTDLQGQIDTNTASITTTANEIALNVETVRQDLQGQITTTQSSIVAESNKILTKVSETVETLDGRLTTAESNITQTAELISSEVKKINDDLSEQSTKINQSAEQIETIASSVETIDGVVTEHSASITVSAEAIENLVTKTTEMDGVITEHGSKLTQTSEAIETAVSNITNIDGRLTAAETSITETADLIGLHASKLEELGDVTSQHTADLIIANNSITSAVEEAKSYADGTLESAKTYVDQRADAIETTVSSNKKDLEGKITSTETSVKQYADGIKTTISETVNGVSGRVTTVETNLEGITQRVGKTETDVANAATKTEVTQIKQDVGTISMTVATQTEQLGKLDESTGSLTTRISSAESSITALNNSIDLKVSTNDFQTLSNTVGEHTTKIASNTAAISIAQDNIASKVSQTEFNALNDTVKGQTATISEHSTSIIQNTNSIANKVESSTFDAYKGTVDNKFTTVNQTVSGINTRVGTAEGKITSVEQSITGITSKLGTAEANIQSLQNQYDGVIDTHMGSVNPTINNEPASKWTTEALKLQHNGDLYYNTATGGAWRYLYNTSTKSASWSKITDEALTSALQNIETLTEKIDGTVSIFYTKPSSYKYGDIWFVERDYSASETGSAIIKENSIMVANGLAEGKSTTTFAWSHWKLKGNVKNKLSELEDDITEALKDDILTDAEKAILTESYNNFELAYKELCAAYTVLIATAVGDTTSVNAVKTAKTTLGNKYNSLVAEITNIIDGTKNKLDDYNIARNEYVTALEAYNKAVAELNEATQVKLSKASDYISDITADGKLTPIEKKQLLGIWKGVAEEYNSNKGIAVNYKIIKSDGTRRTDIYSDATYYNVYKAYHDAYTALSNIFTNTAWKWDDLVNTTSVPSSSSVSGLEGLFNTYYGKLSVFSKMISEITITITDAHQKAKDYTDWIQNHLAPEDNISVVGNGVVLSTILGVKSSTDNSFTSALNASSTHADNTSSKHGRIVFAGGINKATNGDWNNATTVIYEDGHVKFNSGEVGTNFKLGDAVLTSDIGSPGVTSINVAKVTINGKQVPLFTVSTDGNGNVTKISTVYDFQTNKNLIVGGDVASGGQGGSSSAVGASGVIVNGQTYRSDSSGMITIPDYPTSLTWNAISGKPDSLKNPYSLTIGTKTYNGSSAVTITASDIGLGNISNSTYAGGTAVTLNGSSKASSTASFYAPTSGGTSGYYLQAKGNNTAPVWTAFSKSTVGLGNVENTALSTWVGSSNLTTCAQGTIIGSSNIGSQSVNYANTAGSAVDQTARNAASAAQTTANGKWTYNATTIAGVKVNNAGYADNAGSATYAECDSDGNTILTTYLPLAGGTMKGCIVTPGDDSVVIKPNRNNYDQIGGENYKFWKIWATYLYGDLTGNADTATALKTSRTIWGRSFDGSANISGAIENATTGSFSSNVSIGGTLGLTGAATFNSNTTTKGIAYFAGGTTYYVNSSGAAKFASLTSAGAISGTSGSFSSTLSVTGASTFTGATTHNGGISATSLSVSGNTSMGGTLTAKSAIFNGDVRINGNLIITGDSASAGGSGGSGGGSTSGSQVSFTQTLTSGTKIGTLTIDGSATNLYAPSSLAWTSITSKPTTISGFGITDGVTLTGNQALTNKTYNGYTLGTACAYSATTSVTSGSGSLVTSGAVYDYVNAKALTIVPYQESGLTLATFGLNGSYHAAICAPYATASDAGVVRVAKVRTNSPSLITGNATAGRYYGVEMTSDYKLFVNVPWTASTGTQDRSFLDLNDVNGADLAVNNGDTILSNGSSAVTLDFRTVRPIESSLPCTIYILKNVAKNLTVPTYSASGIMILNSTSGAALTTQATVPSFCGLMLIWNIDLARWHGFMLK